MPLRLDARNSHSTLHALPRLFAGPRLSVQAQPFGRAAAREDFCYRSAVGMVARRRVISRKAKIMPLTLNFEWEEAPGSKTLSNPGNARPADQFADAPAKQTARQSAFYRNLVRLAEQAGARTLPINFLTMSGAAKRMDYGCIKIAEHAGFIERLANSPSGIVESITLTWNPSV